MARAGPSAATVASPQAQGADTRTAAPYAGQAVAIGIIEPDPWPFDGCKRREPVFDIEIQPPRVVRKVGWHRCMKCRRPFFSEDVLRLRLCNRNENGGGCRTDEDRFA